MDLRDVFNGPHRALSLQRTQTNSLYCRHSMHIADEKKAQYISMFG